VLPVHHRRNACGNLKNRTEILALLKRLPAAKETMYEEIMEFIEAHHLMGKGLGHVDLHLSASARLSGVMMWTLAKKLNEANKAQGISFA